MSSGRIFALGTTAALFAAALLGAPAQAELLAVYDLVGEDPAGDARNPVVTGQDIPESLVVLTVGRGKYDILSLEMADQPDHLQVKMNMGASYIGTSSMVYLAFFTIAEKPYFVCWNINSAGVTTNYRDVAENLDLSCSRFNSFGTRVGPTARDNGVETGTDAEARVFVRWEVPRSAIGNAAPGTPVTAVRAETWVRGVSTCCPPSTSPQSQYVWNIADRAPNEGEWVYAAGPGAPSLSLNVSVEPNATISAPGTNADFGVSVELLGNGTANVTMTLEGLPDGWSADGLGDAFELSADNLSRIVNLSISIPSGAENQTVNLTLNATSVEAGTATTNITITVDTTLVPPSPTLTTTSASSTTTGTSNDTGAALTQKEASGIPSPAFVPLLLIVVGAAWAVRRRR